MQRLVLSVVFWLALVFPTRVLGFPDGAPAAACNDLTQQHPGTTPQSSVNPFQPDLSPFGSDCLYVPGQTYTLTFMDVNQADQFRGFLWQARLCADDSLVTSGGFLEDTLPSDAQLNDCSPDTAGVTHTSNTDKNSVTVEWVAPNAGTGPITFAYAATMFFDTYWTGDDVRTKCISEDGSDPPPSPSPSPSPVSGSMPDDQVRIGFEQQRLSVEEGEFLYICASVYGDLDYEVYLKIYSDYQGYTSATPGEDFAPVYEEVSLNSGNNRACIIVYTLEDYMLEGEEEFSLYLYFNDEYYYYYGDYYYPDIELDPYTAYVVIADDDIVKVGFENYTYSVYEDDDAYLEVCLVLLYCPNDVSIYRPFQLRVSSADGGATASEDYENVREIVTFNIGDDYYTRQCFTVDIILDNEAEVTEYFSLHIASYDVQVCVPDYAAWAIVNIFDSVELNCTELEDPENGEVTISGVTPGSIAQYTCDDGFATVGGKTRECMRNGEWSEPEPQCIFFEICIDNDTPYVEGNNVTISFTTTAPLDEAECEVSTSSDPPEDCSDGTITFYNLPMRRRNQIFVTVRAYAPCNVSAEVERGFRVDTNGVCSAHLINKIYDNGTHCLYQFDGTGPTTDDVVDTFECLVEDLGGTPVPGIPTVRCDDRLYLLDKSGINVAGDYQVVINAGPGETRCEGRDRRPLRIPFTIE